MALTGASAATAVAAVTPRIVNGLTTHDFPTVGAMLYGFGGVPLTPDNAFIDCSGTLVGCRTFLTAAHCVAGDTDPSHYAVYLQNAGVVAVSSVTYNPDYVSSLSGNDVAILKLATDVTGIQPTPINSTHDLNALGVGFAGTIVGFGVTSSTGRDPGIKRYGMVATANCVPASTGGEGNDKLVCWDFALPVGPPGQDSDTCNGDSGGPLFVDFGAGLEVVGVTVSGSSPFCRPLDHSWDASVYYNAAWIQTELGADSTASCGGIGPVGDPSVSVVPIDGVLTPAHPSDAFTLDVPGAASVLRVALNGQSYFFTFNVDLYVKEGPGASPTSYDCKADGLSVVGGCEFPRANAGTWSLFVSDAAGAGQYQVTATIFPGIVVPGCGNGAIDPGEQCDDGAANGTAASCCTSTCGLEPSGTLCADDGNACTIDACDGATSVCRHPAGHAGAVCRAAAGVCDVAELCDGVSAVCPADALAPDTDGDGVCDAVDPCTNVAHGQDFIAAAHPSLTIRKINGHPPYDSLALIGEFQLAPGTAFSGLDPASRGARLLVTSASAATRIDVSLPSGLFAGPGTRGWKIDAARTTWTFRDATNTPINGITGMQIKDMRRKGVRRLRVHVNGRKSAYAVVPGDEPLHATVVLGSQADAASGLCGESAFAASDCAFNRTGNTVRCRR